MRKVLLVVIVDLDENLNLASEASRRQGRTSRWEWLGGTTGQGGAGDAEGEDNEDERRAVAEASSGRGRVAEAWRDVD